jgi:protein O-mannosyl-transferase
MKSAPKSLWVAAACLVVLTAAAYIPAIRAGFVFDDPLLITDNPLIKASDGLYRFWFTTEPADYYPMTSSLFWLEWRIWGNNPLGYHVLNLLLHAANTVLVWILLRRLKIPGAWLAALVFGIHPVNVATVAWVSEQKNTLSMLFYLSAILLYLQFDENGSWRWYGASLLAFVAGLVSKSAVVMLPVVLLGCVWWRHGQVRERDCLRSAPFFAVSIVMGLAAVWFQSQRVLQGNPIRVVSVAYRLAAAGWVPWFYLGKALLPVNLTVVYPSWKVDPSDWVAYVPGLIVIGSLVLFWRKRHSWGRALLFGWGYFVVTLFPVLGFFDQAFYRFSLVADHWQYSSIIAIIALAVGGTEQAYVRMTKPSRITVGIFGAIALVWLTVSTWSRSSLYASNVTLWRDNVAKVPDSWPHNLLGCALRETGNCNKAIGEFNEAIRLDPAYCEAYSNLGDCLLQVGRVDEAMEQLRRALQLNPGYPEAHNNLGTVLQRVGRLAEAREHFEEALRLKPSYPDACYNLGMNLEEAGRYDEAIRQFERALRLRPDFAQAQFDLGTALQRSGRLAEAREHYEQALRIRPDYAEAHNNLGINLGEAGKYDEAIHEFKQALRLKPDFAEAHYDLGNALMNLQKPNEALGEYKLALQFKPDYPDALHNMAVAFMQLGRGREAVECLERLVKVSPNGASGRHDLGVALLQLRQYPEAITQLEQALRIDPNFAEAHYDLGIALEQVGRSQEAISQYQQALRIRPDYREARGRLKQLETAR